MGRAIWKGSISFGLVQIPVALFSAESSDELHFHMLDKRDLSPVHYSRRSAKTDEEVPWAQIVKGHEHKRGEYVVVTREDFKRANVKATQTIDLVTFVDEHEISPLFFERPYYLAPDKRGEKPYALLRETMRRTRKVGVATVVLRTRQHVVALLVEGDCLVLEVLRYAHELKDPRELDLPGKATSSVSKAELAMAEELVLGMAGSFHPSQFKDTYRDELLAFLEKKAAGDTAPVNSPAQKKGAPVTDIMTLLRKSLAEGKPRAGTKPKTPARRAETRKPARGAHPSKAKHRAA